MESSRRTDYHSNMLCKKQRLNMRKICLTKGGNFLENAQHCLDLILQFISYINTLGLTDDVKKRHVFLLRSTTWWIFRVNAGSIKQRYRHNLEYVHSFVFCLVFVCSFFLR